MIETTAWIGLGVTGAVAALHLAAPVATPYGVDRRGVVLAKQGYRRLTARPHPQAPYPEDGEEAPV